MDQIEIIDLAGDGATRGAKFGHARREDIRAWTADWLASLSAAGILNPTKYVEELVWDTGFLSAIREHTPDLLEEVEAISQAVGQPFALTLGAQLMDEEWAYRSVYLCRGEAGEKCSSIGIVARPGLTFIGQNMDLGRHTDGHQVMLRVAPEQGLPGAMIFTVGNMIGLMGVNSRGLGLCLNSIPQLGAQTKGVPVAFMVRKILQSASLQDAVKVIEETPHATAQHYLIADSNEVRSFEVSPDEVCEYLPPGAVGILHTNHVLGEIASRVEAVAERSSTVVRLASLTSRLFPKNVTLTNVVEALLSRDDPEFPVCRDGDLDGVDPIGFTAGSMVSALEQDRTQIASLVSAGPPCRSGYTEVNLDRDDRGGF